MGDVTPQDRQAISSHVAHSSCVSSLCWLWRWSTWVAKSLEDSLPLKAVVWLMRPLTTSLKTWRQSAWYTCCSLCNFFCDRLGEGMDEPSSPQGIVLYGVYNAVLKGRFLTMLAMVGHLTNRGCVMRVQHVSWQWSARRRGVRNGHWWMQVWWGSPRHVALQQYNTRWLWYREKRGCGPCILLISQKPKKEIQKKETDQSIWKVIYCMVRIRHMYTITSFGFICFHCFCLFCLM